jgi:hypothetical protein
MALAHFHDVSHGVDISFIQNDYSISLQLHGVQFIFRPIHVTDQDCDSTSKLFTIS